MPIELNLAEINLSRRTANHVGRLFREYRNTLNQRLKTEIVDIYTPLIERKAAAAAAASQGRISALDFMQDMYVKLLEMIDSHSSVAPFSSAVKIALNKAKPKVNTLIQREKASIEEFTEKEEYKFLTYDPDKLTLSQKAKLIADWYGKNKHTKDGERKKEILSLILDGESYADIGEKFDISKERVGQIYLDQILRDLKYHNDKNIFRDILNDDMYKSMKIVPADEPLLEEQTIYTKENMCKSLGTKLLESITFNNTKSKLNNPADKQRKLTPEEIHELVLENMHPINVEKELNEIMRTQTHFKDIFTNPSSTARFKQKYKNIQFKIKLPEGCNTPDFMSKIEAISIERLGWNIFDYRD